MQIDFGQRVKTRRKMLKISQEDLALKLGYKHKSSISFIESGRNDIPFEKVTEFANALNTSVEYLCGVIDDPEWQPVEPEKDPREELHKIIDDLSDAQYNSLLNMIQNMMKL